MSVVFNNLEDVGVESESPTISPSCSTQSSPSTARFHPHLPLSAFNSLPLTSSLSSNGNHNPNILNSPPRAKPTTTFLPSFEKQVQFYRNRDGNHKHSSSDPISYYCCSSCGTHLSQSDELISKAFSGRDGKAYLFQSTINTVLGKSEDRELLTGLHTVADLKCKLCSRSVGWYYVTAHEKSQAYKEGKFRASK